MPKQTKEEILAALRAAGEETGGWWTIAAWRAARRRPYPEQVFAVCGSWTQAWAEVGFPPPGRWQGPTARRWTDAEIVEALRRAADGRPLSSTRYDRWQRSGSDGPSIAIVQRRFGSWHKAATFAGVAKVALSQSDVIEAMAELWRQLGREPSQRDWSMWQGCPCSMAAAYLHFGLRVTSLRAEALAAHPDLPQTLTHSTALRRLLAVPREILTEREREIAARAEHGETLREIGEAVGFSRERVRQIALRGGRRRVRHGGGGQILTDEEMVSRLRQHFEATGRISTLQDWMTGRGKPSVAAVLRRFGTWYAAWEAALGPDHAAVVDLRKRGGARGRRRSA